MFTYFTKYIKYPDIFFGDVFSLFKLMCEIKQYSVANKNHICFHKQKMLNYLEKVIKQLERSFDSMKCISVSLRRAKQMRKIMYI